MKRLLVLLCAILFKLPLLYSQPANTAVYEHDINYFIPECFFAPGGEALKISGEYDLSVPKPEEILGFEVGERYAEWSDILKYMYALAQKSDRVAVKSFGKSYQNRDFIQVIITSAQNHANLERIKAEHLMLAGANAGQTHAAGNSRLDITKMPVFVNLINSIHGNEASGVNSTLATAWFFAASQDENVKNILENCVIILVPGLNPDGINRFAIYVNTTTSHNHVADLGTREFRETWPSSRTNHYWIDCNRDWLMCQHPEGANAVKMYLEWMPNVVADHHEMGGDIKGFYFSPGHPLRNHKYVTDANQKLTSQITQYTASALDNIGSLYFSKEGYDDYYLGKGAAYGDVQGSVGILYEQVASRGYLRPTPGGNISFAYTVRNQSFAAISTIFASYEKKDELLAYQKEWYEKQKSCAAKDAVKGYVFNTGGRKAIEYHFIKNMLQHGIDVYRLKQDTRQNGTDYNSSDSYIIPLNQRFYTKIKAMWENVTEFKDSLFYDISTWTFPHAYNLQYSAVPSLAGLIGDKVQDPEFVKGFVTGGKAKTAYVFENSELYSHRLIYELLQNGVHVRISKKPFSYSHENGVKEFGYGTAIVQIQNQPLDEDELYELVSASAERNGVEVYAFNSSLMSDFDFGTPGNKMIKIPKVALITGRGMGVADCGEIWFLLDRRFGMPPSLIDFNNLHNVDLQKYSVIILANGSPSEPISSSVYPSLEKWVAAGGTLIVTGKARSLSDKAKLTDYKTKSSSSKRPDSFVYKPYNAPRASYENVDGAILNCNLDVTSPLGYGYSNGQVAILKNGATAFDINGIKASVPMYYTKEPYLSGCISKNNLKKIAYTPACMVSGHGKGNVIYFVDDLNFRSYWFATTKIFMNAIFFGQLY